METYGAIANLKVTISQGDPVAYIWKLWDGSLVVTRHNSLQKSLNRNSASFSVEAVDARGQKVSLSGGSSTEVTLPPEVPGNQYGSGALKLPYSVDLKLEILYPGQGVGVTWKKSTGETLSTSNPYTHTVTDPVEQLVVRVANGGDPDSFVEIDFALTGFADPGPKITSLFAGIEPDCFVSSPKRVSAAATSNITLSGLQRIDSVDLAPGSRVLVTGQSDKKQNGIYACSTGSWTRTSDTLVVGTTVGVLFGSLKGNSYVIIGDSGPDGIEVGVNNIQFERVKQSYGSVISADSEMIAEFSVQPENSSATYDVSVLGSSLSGSIPAMATALVRARKNTSNSTPVLSEIRATVTSAGLSSSLSVNVDTN